MDEPREITNPFPGLRPFETDEYRLFFGREGQSDELITRLGRSRFLAVVGTSGSGKSSLVRAGLLPALRGGMMAGAGARWRIAVMRPGGDPVGNLARALAEKGVLAEAGGGLPPSEAKALMEATLRGGSLGLVEAVKQARLADGEKLLVIADQFEEIFRFRAARAPSSADDAAAFVKLLLEAVRQRVQNVYVVLTMRSDFLGDCSQFQGLPEAINDGQYLIPRMNRDERRAAIVGPVRVARGRMSEPLINRLLNDVGDNPDQLPILQHALMRTWENWAADHSGREPVDLRHYEAVGTMAGALSEHADEAYNELPDERGRQIARLLFKALTERGADNREIRRPTRLSEACLITGAGAAEVAAVVEVFRKEGRSFLMPPEEIALTPDTVLDISHESLIRNWEQLKKWVEQEAQSARTYKRLAEAAVLNRAGQEGLLQDPGLSLALDWREKSKPNAAWGRRYHPEFDTAIAYLDESRETHEAALAEIGRRKQEEIERERHEMEQTRAFAEQQARSARRLRWAVVAMAVLFVLSLGTAAYAYRLKQFAQDSYESAVKASAVAEEEREHAVTERERAEEARRHAVGLAEDLKKNNEKLVAAQSESDRQARRADERAKEAEEATKKARDAQERAEGLLEAAVTARRQTEAAMRRSELTKVGLEAARRNDPDDAYSAFQNLAKALEEAIPHAPPEQVRQLTIDRGWALSNLGAVQLGRHDFYEARDSYEQARDVLEGVWPKERQRDKTPDPVLFETYHGLGHAYQSLVLNGYGKGATSRHAEQEESYTLAEKVYTDALGLQKERLAKLENEGESPEVKKAVKTAAGEVAAGHLNLARLYTDGGHPEVAEKYLVELLEVRKKHGTTDEIIAARKELAEFYRNQDLSDPKLFEAATRSYNDLINALESVPRDSDDVAKKGAEIADAYNELAEVYRSQLGNAGEELTEKEKAEKVKADKVNKEKADVNYAAATAIQRYFASLRRAMSVHDTSTLAESSDAAADAYARLGKFDFALALYESALDERKSRATGQLSSEVWKSYDKITRLYREKGFTDDAKAEEYNQLLIQEFAKYEPNSPQHAAALSLCADIYVKQDRTSDARAYYENALGIYARQSETRPDFWMNQNIVLYKITEMYAKKKMRPEMKEAALRRLELLTAQLDKVVGVKDTLPRGSITLVTEYLDAVETVAFTQSVFDKNDAGAADVYRKAFDACDFIKGRIYNQRALNAYIKTLNRYKTLLAKLGRQQEAAGVEASVSGVKAKLNDIVQEQSPQPTQTGQTQPAAAQ